jgi:asparagine synthase (glutamine-hydrolysing)
MSGIAGIINLDGAPVAHDAVDTMLTTMARRGPDRRRSWRGANAGLGQALLATTPEATAEIQPWIHADSGCVVISDSRLDNRPELLRALDIQYASADGIGDGELLHAAWQRWGNDCADRLLGDFAFAIWDPRNRRLFCARDVMGVRPFYYHCVPGRLFVFASEARAILSQPGVPLEIDEGRIADALVPLLEGINKTCTFYKHIVRLPPAHTLTLDGGQSRVRKYWEPVARQPRDLPRGEAEWAEALRSELLHAVRRRLRSSRNVGSMLSGGLDSSSVVALASDLFRSEGRGQLSTFSAIDSRAECRETLAVAAMIRSAKTNATTIDVSSATGSSLALSDRYRGLGEPFDGHMALIDAMYGAAGKAGVRSLMDGMPADNLYLTSLHAQHLARRRKWRPAHRAGVRLHREMANRLPRIRAIGTVAGAWLPASGRRLLERSANHQFLEMLIGTSLIDRKFADRVRLGDRLLELRDDSAQNVTSDPSGQALSSMTAAHITVAIERYGRVAAFHGVEPRHPYLDRELVEFHAWLPAELRRRPGWEKWVLRKAVEGVMPTEVAWRAVKDYLGPPLLMRTMGPLFDDDATVGAMLETLDGYLDREKARSAVQIWRATGDGQSFSALHPAALVAQWLDAHSVV